MRFQIGTSLGICLGVLFLDIIWTFRGGLGKALCDIARVSRNKSTFDLLNIFSVHFGFNVSSNFRGFSEVKVLFAS